MCRSPFQHCSGCATRTPRASPDLRGVTHQGGRWNSLLVCVPKIRQVLPEHPLVSVLSRPSMKHLGAFLSIHVAPLSKPPDPANETQPLSSLPSQPRWLWPCGRRGHWRSLCPESLLARAPVISFYGPPPVLGARRAALPDALACFYATAIKQMEGSTADHESPPLERRLTPHAEQSILTSIVAAVSLIALAMVIAQTNISRSPRLKILQATGLWLCAILLLVASIWRHFFERRKYRVTRTDWLFYISFFFILLVLLVSVLSVATSFLPLPAHDRLAGSGGELQDFSTSK